jgi:hypothetical protein
MGFPSSAAKMMRHDAFICLLNAVQRLRFGWRLAAGGWRLAGVFLDSTSLVDVRVEEGRDHLHGFIRKARGVLQDRGAYPKPVE